ncbi:HlyC/CorC family transporter [Desulforhopalus vacuolatus]|nr:HlyC/CorC family transporter [Desulforhopalus vacuolatus]
MDDAAPSDKTEDSDPSEPEEKEICTKSFSLSLLQRILNFILFRKKGMREDLDQEIQDILEEGEEHGLISSLEEKMINSLLEFHDTTASEVMTPAAEIVACEISSPVSDLITLAIDSGFTRIPVYRENIDNMIGIIHVKDLLRLCAGLEEKESNLEEFLRPVNICAEERPIVEILREFQRTKLHISIVSDEFGSVRGLVTMEDILEEIVGEIDDEYDDVTDEEVTFEVLTDGCVRVHGWVDVEKIEEYFNVDFPEGPYESIGGLVVQTLGRLAEKNDEVEVSGLKLRVEKASMRHIERIRVSRVDPNLYQPEQQS